MELSGSLIDDLFTFVKDSTYKETDSLTGDTKLFVEGIFDSMGFVLLLDFLEEKFNVISEDSDLIEENFESINAIAAYVLNKSQIEIQ